MKPSLQEVSMIDQEELGSPGDKRKKAQASRYKSRFQQVSETGGLELEDIESEIDEKGETKLTVDGELLGGSSLLSKKTKQMVCRTRVQNLNFYSSKTSNKTIHVDSGCGQNFGI